MQPIKKMLEGCQLTAIPSKPKIKYCIKKVNHTTDNASGTNESNRTSIYHGIYKNLDENENKLKAFIRRYASAEIDDNAKTTLRELATLRHGQNLHENFIRYFGMEEENNFSYVAIEWCICSVEDLYGKCGNGTNWIGETIGEADINNSLGPKEILLQATKGLEYLHRKERKVHRNIKPSNFLIAQVGLVNKYKVKLSDFCLSKEPKDIPVQTLNNMEESNTWIAPGLNQGETHSVKKYFAYDVFVLACFFHFVLTKGYHPFDDQKTVKLQNILNRKNRIMNVEDTVYCCETWDPRLLETNEQAVFLLKQMIKFNPDERYKLNQVLDSHYFLSEDYISSTTNRVELNRVSASFSTRKRDIEKLRLTER